VGNLTLCEDLTGGAFDVVNSQSRPFFFFPKKSNARGLALRHIKAPQGLKLNKLLPLNRALTDPVI